MNENTDLEVTTEEDVVTYTEEQLQTIINEQLEAYKQQALQEQEQKAEEERISKLTAKEKIQEEYNRLEKEKELLEKSKMEFRNKELTNYTQAKLLEKGFSNDFARFIQASDEKDIDSNIEQFNELFNKSLSEKLKESTQKIVVTKSNNSNINVNKKGLSYSERLALS